MLGIFVLGINALRDKLAWGFFLRENLIRENLVWENLVRENLVRENLVREKHVAPRCSMEN
jgi:hypothetical protein